MCGIAGYFHFDGRKVEHNGQIIRMLEFQKHRGPDDSGIRFFSLENKTSEEITFRESLTVSSKYEGVLGFNRLSILDLSHHGHQPMSNREGDVILCLNGEIYNAFDFKEELIKDGFSFRSTSDTEVVLNLYLKYGFDKMITKLNGMFAIVIVDLRTEKVFITRDRFGIKPLYFVTSNSSIAFASELKSFYAMPEFKPSLNISSLDEFVLFRGVLKNTLFNEVQSLEPGSSLVFNRKGILKTEKFFDVNNYERVPVSSSESDLKNFIRKALSKSVKSQLLSDVKVGCQLSGGVDSSIVASMAKNHPDQEFESFSITFDNPAYSEEKYVDYVSDKLELKSHKFTLQPEFYLDHLQTVTNHLETPINHPNTVGLYLLSQRARESVTVLLSGEGADEIFGGYSRFSEVKYRYGKTFYKTVLRFPDNAINYLKWYVNRDRFAVMAASFVPLSDAKRLMPNFCEERATRQRLDLYNGFSGSVFDKQVKYELTTYLPDLLIRQDKMSMAHSIENRVPFLDNNMVASSFAVPEKYLIRKESNSGKYILKEIGASIFERRFTYRNKVGFGIPLREIFKQSQFEVMFNEFIFPSIRSNGLFNHRYIDSLYKNIDRLNYKELEVLWLVVAFEFWYDNFLGRKS